MKTDLINYGQGIYELKILNSNESFMIEWDDECLYRVTMLENDEAVEDMGSFEYKADAIEHIKTLY